MNTCPKTEPANSLPLIGFSPGGPATRFYHPNAVQITPSGGKRPQASLCLEELVRADYETEEIMQLTEKIRNGLGCWLTFVTESEVNSTNNRTERALREQVVMRKIFGGLRSETGVRIHETLSTLVATWERQELDPSDQLASMLRGERPESRAEASTKRPR